MTDSETFSLREVERIYRVHRNTLRRAIDEGRLRAIRSNDGNWIILPDDLDAYLRDRKPAPGGRPPRMAMEKPPASTPTPMVAQLVRELEADNATLRQQAAILEERDKAARAVMLEVRELMQVQAERIDDLKIDKGRLETDKAQMVALLKQAHDRLVDVDAERKDLLARVLGIVDLNIPPESTTDVSRRRDRH